MEDFEGNVVNIGDSVIYVKKSFKSVKLARGNVKEINGRYIKVDNHFCGVTSQNFMKVK